MAQPNTVGEYDLVTGLVVGKQVPMPQDLDVTVLAFAQWLSDMRTRSNASVQQTLAEMGIIRDAVTANNTELLEFKRNSATVQQQMQSQISDLRDKLTDAYSEIVSMKKTRSLFEQTIQAEYQALSAQFQSKTMQLQAEVSELRTGGVVLHRQSPHGEEADTAAQATSGELNSLRADHEQAITNLAENMSRWNEALRDIAKELHDFQKSTNARLAEAWDGQSRGGVAGGSLVVPLNASPVAPITCDIFRAEESGVAGERSPPPPGVRSPPPQEFRDFPRAWDAQSRAGTEDGFVVVPAVDAEGRARGEVSPQRRQRAEFPHEFRESSKAIVVGRQRSWDVEQQPRMAGAVSPPPPNGRHSMQLSSNTAAPGSRPRSPLAALQTRWAGPGPPPNVSLGVAGYGPTPGTPPGHYVTRYLSAPGPLPPLHT